MVNNQMLVQSTGRAKKHKSAWRAWLALILVMANVGLGATGGQAAPAMQGGSPQAKALNLLEDLSPEERVGQLFVVTFSGAFAAQENQIYDLIANYHVGGVILRQDMDNFVAPNTIEGLVSLTSALQAADAASAEKERADLLGGEGYQPAHLPLFIGISQEGDGYPNDQILEGLSPAPSAMARGAACGAAFARPAGELLGAELPSGGNY